MSKPKLISPLLDGFLIGEPISEHHGVRCCPAIHTESEEKYIVKIVSIPASQVQLEALLLTGAYQSHEDALAYFRDLADAAEKEAELLQQLAALEGFTDFTGWQLIPLEDGVGFELYFLSPYRLTLERQFRQSSLTHLGAVNLGLDLCAALAVCRRSGSLYVDLKPENVFITDNQEYRIGDLGFISLSSLRYASLPDKYRSAYTAPEISDAYSSLNDTLDIYALGLILYQAFNNHALPAVGEPLAPPAYADYEMAEIILKALAQNPADRWQDPVQMGQALVSYLQRNTVNDTPIIPPAVPLEPVEEESVDTEEIPETAEPAAAEEVPEEAAEAVSEEISNAEENPVEEIPEEALQTEEAPAADFPEEDSEPFILDDFAEDETLPDEETAQDLEEAPVTEEVSEMLAQADDLIAHEPPAPAVAPEPVEVPFPSASPDEDESAQPEETSDEPEAETAEPEEEPKALPVEESEDAQLPADTAVPSRRSSGSNRRYTSLIIALSTVLALLLLTVGGLFFYEESYLQSIDNITLSGRENCLTVTLDTDIDDSLLTVICTDAYGNTIPQPVVAHQAVFTNLRPGTKYTVSVKIDGFHQLVGITASSYTTAEQTSIVNFNAITGDQDGTVILNFSVQGPENTAWNIRYSAPGIPEQTVPCTSHMAVLTGLEVGTTYTFRLVSTAELYTVGTDTLQHTVSRVVRPENLRVLGFFSGALKLQWDVPADIPVASWSVRCYNTDGFDSTVTVTEPSAVFEGLDISKGYTVDVKAAGMSESGQATIAPNSVTFHKFTADTSASGKVTLTWEYEGSKPSDQWQLLYSIDGGEMQLLTSKEDSCTFTNLVPGAHYTVTFQAAPGATYFSGTTEFDTPEAPDFDSYKLTKGNMTFQMCRTPKEAGWDWWDVPKKDFTTEFAVGGKASFVIQLSKYPAKSDDSVSALFVIRDSSGVCVAANAHSRTWNAMLNGKYIELEMPIMPQTAGSYTAEIYFNGAHVHTQSFTVV